MKSIRCNLFFAIVLMTSWAGTAKGLENDKPSKSIVVGVVAPLTGPLAAAGVTLKNSILMAAEEEGQKSVRFIFEDDQFVPKLTVGAVRRFISVDRVDAIVTFGSSTSLAIAGIVERAGVPTISVAISEKVSRDRKFVFRFIVPMGVQASVMASEVKRRGYRSLAMLHSNQDGAIAQYEAFRAVFKISISADIEVDPQETDLRTIVMKLIADKPDAVFLGILPPQFSIISKLLRSLGYKGEMFSGIQLQNESEVKASNGALTNAWLVSPDDSQATKFYADYRRRFNEFPVPDGAYGYDIAHMLISASQSPNIAATLRDTDRFEGIFGTYGLGKLNTFEIPGIIKVVSKSGTFEEAGVVNRIN